MRNLLVEEIVSAIEKGEIQTYYQPQYNTTKSVIGGAEALVRWKKSDGSFISPGEFIPNLEKSGHVDMIDWFVAEEACKTIRELGNKAIRISVNFARVHAHDKDFVSKLDNLVDCYGIDKRLLGIEVTESDVVTDTKIVIDWVKDISDAGYTVSIDDFGCGMSSLSFVKDVPAKILKIDRSFLNDNCQSERGRMALESVFYFAHRLKLTTVVEGVETEEQLQFINTCDCDYIQGFLFSKAVSKDEFLNMCMQEAPVEMSYSGSFNEQSMFGQVQLLLDSMYTKYPFIILVNLSKNVYQIIHKEDYFDDSLSEIGTYDDGYEFVKSLYPKKLHAKIEEAFSRENLMKAYNRGEKSVIRIINQIKDDGNSYRWAIEDYFIENTKSNDIFFVSFLHSVDFDSNTYIGENLYDVIASKVECKSAS